MTSQGSRDGWKSYGTSHVSTEPQSWMKFRLSPQCMHFENPKTPSCQKLIIEPQLSDMVSWFSIHHWGSENLCIWGNARKVSSKCHATLGKILGSGFFGEMCRFHNVVWGKICAHVLDLKLP
jgi:hypothetical protein